MSENTNVVKHLPASDPEPTQDARPTLLEIVESMTGYETEIVEQHFGKDFEDLGGGKMMLASLYIYRTRTDGTVTWEDVMRLTRKQVNDNFLPPKDAAAPKG